MKWILYYYTIVLWTQPRVLQRVYSIVQFIAPKHRNKASKFNSRIKPNNLEPSQRGYWTLSMFAAFVFNRLGSQDNWTPFLSGRYQVGTCLKDGARVGSMLEKEVKRYLTSRGRKQYHRPSYPSRPCQLAQSIWSEESNGKILASGKCCVYLDQL